MSNVGKVKLIFLTNFIVALPLKCCSCPCMNNSLGYTVLLLLQLAGWTFLVGMEAQSDKRRSLCSPA